MSNPCVDLLFRIWNMSGTRSYPQTRIEELSNAIPNIDQHLAGTVIAVPNTDRALATRSTGQTLATHSGGEMICDLNSIYAIWKLYTIRHCIIGNMFRWIIYILIIYIIYIRWIIYIFNEQTRPWRCNETLNRGVYFRKSEINSLRELGTCHVRNSLTNKDNSSAHHRGLTLPVMEYVWYKVRPQARIGNLSNAIPNNDLTSCREPTTRRLQPVGTAPLGYQANPSYPSRWELIEYSTCKIYI